MNESKGKGKAPRFADQHKQLVEALVKLEGLRRAAEQAREHLQREVGERAAALNWVRGQIADRIGEGAEWPSSRYHDVLHAEELRHRALEQALAVPADPEADPAPGALLLDPDGPENVRP